MNWVYREIFYWIYSHFKQSSLPFLCAQESDFHNVTLDFSGLVASPLGEGNGTPLQYSCLENPMDRGAWWAAVHGVDKSSTRLSDCTFTFHFHALEKEMATHSSVLAWRILGTAEPGGLPSMELHGVGHYWSDLAVAAAVKSTCILRTLYSYSYETVNHTRVEIFCCFFHWCISSSRCLLKSVE